MHFFENWSCFFLDKVGRVISYLPILLMWVTLELFLLNFFVGFNKNCIRFFNIFHALLTHQIGPFSIFISWNISEMVCLFVLWFCITVISESCNGLVSHCSLAVLIVIFYWLGHDLNIFKAFWLVLAGLFCCVRICLDSNIEQLEVVVDINFFDLIDVFYFFQHETIFFGKRRLAEVCDNVLVKRTISLEPFIDKLFSR